MSEKVCAGCRFVRMTIKPPQGSEQKELIVTCEKGHAPIWLFSGGECEDYQPKAINQTQEQK